MHRSALKSQWPSAVTVLQDALRTGGLYPWDCMLHSTRDSRRASSPPTSSLSPNPTKRQDRLMERGREGTHGSP
jgi:hypothetical protein